MKKKFTTFLKNKYHSIKGDTLEQNSPPVILQDEFVKWLSFANAGMLNWGNLYCIDYATKNILSNNPVIEIGSFCGLSTNIINYYLDKHQKENKIICSDKWEFEGNDFEMVGESRISHTSFKSFVKDSFMRNVQLFSSFNIPYAIEVFSDEFFELWKDNNHHKDVFDRDVELGGAISFAFIDGNHTYEYAKRDFENTHKYLEVGGFILFDDSADDSTFECRHLMKEIVANTSYELVFKNPNYLFKKIA